MTPLRETPAPQTYNFVLSPAGIGDHLSWLSALRWIADTYSHVRGRIFCPTHLREIVASVFSDLDPSWEVLAPPKGQITHGDLAGHPTKLAEQADINASGGHLVDVGFILYANLSRAPSPYHRMMPLVADPLPERLSCQTPRQYAVVTTNAVAENRRFQPRYANAVIDHLLSRGIMPVFLGKREITAELHARSAEGYAFDKGIDLREQTSLMEAAAVLEGAQLVVGVDNGLLHLAQMVNCPGVFGVTTASIHHRYPRPAGDARWAILSPEAPPACIACQSSVRYVQGFDSRTCYYKDDACTFSFSTKQWLDAIDEVLA